MLDHFYRTHRLSHLKAYRWAQKSNDNEHSHRFDDKIAEFLTELKGKEKGTETNLKYIRSKKAHGLVEI